MEEQRENFMRLALAEAKAALDAGEIPVGCVIVSRDGKVISTGRNTREEARSALGHAELSAIAEACRLRGDWRLADCAIYVTVEPCPMCAGAIINARIPVVVYGAKEPNFGSCGSVVDLFSERYGHHPAVYGGVLENECSALMSEFFKKLR